LRRGCFKNGLIEKRGRSRNADGRFTDREYASSLYWMYPDTLGKFPPSPFEGP